MSPRVTSCGFFPVGQGSWGLSWATEAPTSSLVGQYSEASRAVTIACGTHWWLSPLGQRWERSQAFGAKEDSRAMWWGVFDFGPRALGHRGPLWWQ